MKRILSLLLIFTISTIPLCSFATDEEMMYGEVSVNFEDVVYLNQLFEVSLFSIDDEDLKTRFENAKNKIESNLKSFNQEINIYEYSIPVELTGALFTSVFLYNPDLFYINNYCWYSYYTENPDVIAALIFDFAYTPAEYAERKQIFDTEVEKITSLVAPNMGELERALIVHDYIDLHCKYDTNPDESGKYKTSSYRADGIIVDKVGVCQSYSMAYYYIMNLLNVETDYAESKQMNHMWNIFKIGENWYHVDSTWDDPVPEGFAYVDHQHFLASDTLISSGEKPHDKWSANHKCTDTSLDNHFWRNIKGSIAFDGKNKAYYHTEYNENGNAYEFEILAHNLNDHTTEAIKTEKEIWFVWDSPNYYTNVYSDVSFYNGKLYYNTPTEIIEMNTDGSEAKTIEQYKNNDGYIYGSMMNGHHLTFGVTQTPKGECQEYSISLEDRIKFEPLEENSTDILISVDRKYNDFNNIPGKIIAVLYDENDIIKESKIIALSDCQIINSESTTIVDFENKNGMYIKLMWWDMNSLSPISANIIYNI